MPSFSEGSSMRLAAGSGADLSPCGGMHPASVARFGLVGRRGKTKNCCKVYFLYRVDV